MNTNRLVRPQVRVLLHYLGIPYNRQPGSVKEEKALLKKLMEEQPEKAQQAYDAIVMRKVPEPVKTDLMMPKEQVLAELGQFIRDYWKTESDNAINKVADSTVAAVEKERAAFAKAAKDAIAEESKKFRTIQIKVGGKAAKKLDKFIAPSYFEKLLKLMQARVNIMLVGPAGCGKTFIAAKAAEALGLNFGSQSCSEGVSESVFTGWLLPTGKGGTFEHVMANFLEIYEKGGVFLLDELDGSDPNVLVYINQALANDGFYLPQRFKKPQVKKHPDFVAIAAANTFGNGADAEYVGRNQLDAATLDRFRIGTIQVDYDEGVEKALIESANDEVYQWGINIRKQIRQHGLRRILSTRNMIDAVKVCEAGLTLQDVKDSYFADWSEEEKRMVA